MRNVVYRMALPACLAALIVAGLYAYCTKDLPPMDVFRNSARHAELHVFPNSSHMPFYEEPQA